MQLLQKENILIVLGIVCIILWWWGKQIKKSELTQKIVEWLPKLGGLIFGVNTLIQIS